MTTKWDPKDPDDIDSFGIDWSPRLAGGETISSSTWLPFSPADGSLVKQSASYTTSSTTIWLSGGIDGVTYEVTNRVVTTAGHQWDQTEKLRIKSN